MFIPYDPCKDCKQPKETCRQCSYEAVKENYRRALAKIVELNDELGRKTTILV